MYCLKNATNCKEQTHSLKTLEKASFSVDSIPKDAIPFYTGFSNKQVFKDVLEYLNPGEKGENITYMRNTIKQPNEYTVPKAGKPRKLKPRNEKAKTWVA